jgi:serine/threonine protein kinase
VIDETLGRYRITGKLGEGGMGVVYHARDDQLQRDLAIKLLSTETLNDSTARARLVREARAAASLNHPNICTIYEVGEAGGQVYIAMELVDGSPLSRQLESGPLPYAKVLRCGHQLADALGHAHERGIVHRDLKSLNVMVTSEGRCKVLDFGLATRFGGPLTDATAQTMLTETGDLVGTPAYMAPEQFQGQAADARSDVWALGVVLYEMVSGTRPFNGRTTFEVTSAILSKPPAPLPSKTPIALRVVVERCLDKNPQNRYANAGEVRSELESILQGNASSWKTWQRRIRRKPLAISAVALILALALGIAFNTDRIRERFGFSSSTIESVAVLPLANLSGDSAQDSLAAAMTDALITELSKFGGLKRIIGRGDVMQYKDTTKSYAEIAKELEVESLVTWSIQRSREQVSVNVQLIDPATGVPLWAERYDRGMSDVLQLQNDIVNNIKQQLRLRMSPEERDRLARTGPVNPEAKEAYDKGIIAWYKHTPTEVEEARQYFELALKKDRFYAPAYRGLGYVATYALTSGTPPKDVIENLRELNRKMRDLGLHEDPTQGEYFESAADIAFYFDWDWKAAETNFKKAVEVKPKSVDLQLFYWHFLAAMNRLTEAGAVIEYCLQLDPINAFAQSSYGLYLLLAQRFDDAIGQFRKVIDEKKDFGVARLGLWTAYHHKEMFREALGEAKTAFADDDEMIEALTLGERESGYKGAMRRAAELMAQRSRLIYILPTNIARVYAYAGDNEKAIELLENAYEDRDSGMALLQVDPDWKTLRTSPRFQKLVERMNFP